MKAILVAMTLFVGPCLAMLAVGCGGGEEEETPIASPVVSPVATETASPTSVSPSPTPPPETRAELEALLKAAALRIEDLPSGFTLNDEAFWTNEEAAQDDPVDPQEWLDNYNEWGRLLSYRVSYKKEVGPGALLGSTAIISTQVTIYRDAQGAGAFMAANRQRLENPEQVAKLEARWVEDGDYYDASVSMMSFAAIGDGSCASETTALYSDQETKLVVQDVDIREGRVIGNVATLAVNSPSPVEELENLARKLDERIEAALSPSQVSTPHTWRDVDHIVAATGECQEYLVAGWNAPDEKVREEVRIEWMLPRLDEGEKFEEWQARNERSVDAANAMEHNLEAMLDWLDARYGRPTASSMLESIGKELDWTPEFIQCVAGQLGVVSATPAAGP